MSAMGGKETIVGISQGASCFEPELDANDLGVRQWCRFIGTCLEMTTE